METKHNQKMRNFINALHIVAEQGFSKWAVLTHAWHESGAFTKVIGDFNFWGIKKPKNWKGKVHSIKTHEYENNKRIDIVAEFIDFETIFKAINWYCGLIRRLYPDAYENRNNPIEYFRGLVSRNIKYATDPAYSIKLISLYNVLKDEIGLKFLVEKV